MHRLAAIITVMLCAMMLLPAAHAASPWEKSVPAAESVGKGKFHYLFMHIYDAELLAPNGAYEATSPFALKLTYHRALEGEDIAEESIRQMRKQGLKDEAILSGWLSEMRAIFPNIQKGDSLTGLRTADGKTHFYYGETLVGEVNDPAFTDAFFGIWLSPKTTEPSLRKQLLGNGK